MVYTLGIETKCTAAIFFVILDENFNPLDGVVYSERTTETWGEPRLIFI